MILSSRVSYQNWLIYIFLMLPSFDVFASRHTHLCFDQTVKELIEEREERHVKNGVHIKTFRKLQRVRLRKELKNEVFTRLDALQNNLIPHLSSNHQNPFYEEFFDFSSCKYLEQQNPSLLNHLQYRAKDRQNIFALFQKLQDSNLLNQANALNMTRDLIKQSLKAQVITKILKNGSWQKIYYQHEGNKVEYGIRKALQRLSFPAPIPNTFDSESNQKLAIEELLEAIYGNLPILRRPSKSAAKIIAIQQVDERIIEIVFGRNSQFKNKFLGIVTPKIRTILDSMKNTKPEYLDSLLVNFGLKLGAEDSFVKTIEKSISPKKSPIAKIHDFLNLNPSLDRRVKVRKYLLAWQIYLTLEFENDLDILTDEFIEQSKTSDARLKKIHKLLGNAAFRWNRDINFTLKNQCNTGNALVELEEPLFNIFLSKKINSQSVKLKVEEDELKVSEVDSGFLDLLSGRCNTNWGVIESTKREAALGIAAKSLFALGVLSTPKASYWVKGHSGFRKAFSIGAIGASSATEVTSILMQAHRKFNEAPLAGTLYNQGLRERNTKYFQGLALALVGAPLGGTLTWFSGIGIASAGLGLNVLNPFRGVKFEDLKKVKNIRVEQALQRFSGSKNMDPFFLSLLAITGFTSSTVAQWQAYSEGNKNPLENPVFYIDVATTYIKLLGFQTAVKTIFSSEKEAEWARLMANTIRKTSGLNVAQDAWAIKNSVGLSKFVYSEMIKQTTNIYMNNTASDINFLMHGSRVNHRYLFFKSWYGFTAGPMFSAVIYRSWKFVDQVFRNFPKQHVGFYYPAKILLNTFFNFIDQKSKSYAMVNYMNDPHAPFLSSMLVGFQKTCRDFTDTTCKIMPENMLDDPFLRAVSQRIPEETWRKSLNLQDLEFSDEEEEALRSLIQRYLGDRKVIGDIITTQFKAKVQSLSELQ